MTVLIGCSCEFTLIALTGILWLANLSLLKLFGGNCKEYLGLAKYPSSFTAQIGTSNNPEKIKINTYNKDFIL